MIDLQAPGVLDAEEVEPGAGIALVVASPRVGDENMPEAQRDSGRGAAVGGAGILLSRLPGLVRARLLAHYFGTTPVGAAFLAALRIPNVLQNLLGEGVLSASFIPVYAGLRAKKEEEAAQL